MQLIVERKWRVIWDCTPVLALVFIVHTQETSKFYFCSTFSLIHDQCKSGNLITRGIRAPFTSISNSHRVFQTLRIPAFRYYILSRNHERFVFYWFLDFRISGWIKIAIALSNIFGQLRNWHIFNSNSITCKIFDEIIYQLYICMYIWE